jgi:hypothetical protein
VNDKRKRKESPLPEDNEGEHTSDPESVKQTKPTKAKKEKVAAIPALL